MITRKETTMLALLGLGLLYLRNNNHDVNRDGNTDDMDKGLLILLGAAAVFYLM